MIKVSIIVPIYGVEKYLRQCVDLILAQTLKEIEIILIDDDSLDACPQIIDEYAARDARVVAVRQENGGYGRAVNQGLALAKGETISIIGLDDWVELIMFEKLYAILFKENIDVVKKPFVLVTPGESLLKRWVNRRQIFPSTSFNVKENGRFLYYHSCTWSCLYRVSFLNENNIRMVEHLGDGWADNLFQIPTLCKARTISCCNEHFYNYRQLQLDEKLLRNWHLPFDRTKEIHTWLEVERIAHPEILANFCKREFNYIHIVAKSKSVAKNKDTILFEIKDWITTIVKPYLDVISLYLNVYVLRILKGLIISPKWIFWKLRHLTQWEVFRKRCFQFLNILILPLNNTMHVLHGSRLSLKVVSIDKWERR